MSRYRASLQVGKHSTRRPYAREVLDSASDSADASATDGPAPGHWQTVTATAFRAGRPAASDPTEIEQTQVTCLWDQT